HLGHRDKIVAPVLTAFTLDTALFVALARCAELSAKTPVRPKRNEPRGLFPLSATQDLLHCAGQVIESEQMKYAAKPRKRQLVRFKKCLLRGVRIGPVEGRSRGHRAHAEDIDLARLAVELCPNLVPV